MTIGVIGWAVYISLCILIVGYHALVYKDE